MKRTIEWIALTILGAFIGSFVTYSLSHHIYPVWGMVTRPFTGDICCYKAVDPVTVPVFSRSMSKLLEVGYVITFSPKAEKVEIGSGVYDCKRSYLELVFSILDRNVGNLVYSIDRKNRVIHISTP
jgi:hypothetical protein